MTEHILKITPFTTFPRSFLPIFWLAGSTPRLFSIKRNIFGSPFNVNGIAMIGKVEGEKHMVVIEQVRDCLYSMCSLKKDLKVKDIRQIAKKSKEVTSSETQSSEGENIQAGGGEWWGESVVRNTNREEGQDISLQFLSDVALKTESG